MHSLVVDLELLDLFPKDHDLNIQFLVLLSLLLSTLGSGFLILTESLLFLLSGLSKQFLLVLDRAARLERYLSGLQVGITVLDHC